MRSTIFSILLPVLQVEAQADSASVPEKSSISKLKEQIPLDQLFSTEKILLSIAVLIFTYFLVHTIKVLLERLAENQTAYRLLIKRTVPISSILLWSMAIYVVIAGIISPSLETIIAVSASVGIAVGFAAQDILKNIFGGVMIIADRPFQVGDKIEVGEHYGEVIMIGLRSTRIVTPEDSIVSIPNAELVNHSVSNANSGALNCQVVADIYVPATIPLVEIKEIGRKAAISSRYVYLNKPISVLVENQVNNQLFFVKVKVKAYVLDIRYEFAFKSDLTQMIMQELNCRNLIPTVSNTRITQERDESVL